MKTKVAKYLFPCVFMIMILQFIALQSMNLYQSLKDEVTSFEVERGDNSITCVTAWAGGQATMSCLPSQWMEAEVVYDQADFEAPTP
jgi:hypothetical protein